MKREPEPTNTVEAHNAESVRPYYEGQNVALYHGDCREILPRLVGHVVVTDPPFNVGKDVSVRPVARTGGTHGDRQTWRQGSEEVGLVRPTPAIRRSRWFAGTGTTLVAARAAGCRAIGIELEERWCEVAARRLDQGTLDFWEAS